MNAFAEVARRAAAGEATALATVIETVGSAPAERAMRMAVGAAGRITGTVGGGRVEAKVIARATEAEWTSLSSSRAAPPSVETRASVPRRSNEVTNSVRSMTAISFVAETLSRSPSLKPIERPSGLPRCDQNSSSGLPSQLAL